MNTVVIKLGGAIATRELTSSALWPQVSELQKQAHVVIVHGGGPQATEVAKRLGHSPNFVRGRRVTSELDLRIVAWTLRGEINATLAADASAAGLRAVGVSGADGVLIRVHRRPQWVVDGEPVDFGRVGDIEKVDVTLLTTLLEAGFLPIVASLSADAAGTLFNVNADTVACSVAAALKATELHFVTDTGGLRRHAEDGSSLVARCTRADFEEGLDAGWITGGMGVKMKVGFDALNAQVSTVYIIGVHDLIERSSATQLLNESPHCLAEPSR